MNAKERQGWRFFSNTRSLSSNDISNQILLTLRSREASAENRHDSATEGGDEDVDAQVQW